MANTLQGRDGKMGLAWLLEVDETKTTGSLAIGDIGFVTAHAASGDLKDVELNTPFFVNKAITLASGDEFVKMIPRFLGFATGKSVSYSKDTQDITCDFDVALGKNNVVTDGVITTTGSISGMNLLSADEDSAINIIKSRFGGITKISDAGAVDVIEANTTEKDIIVIIWNAREVKAQGDVYDIEVLPVLFTSLSKGAEYGSPQNFDLDFSASATDENGYIAGNLMVTRGATNPFAGEAWSTKRK